MMRIIVNGKPREIDAGGGALALPELLQRFEVNPRLVAVAINGDVIAKDTYNAVTVHDSDEVEIVRMVGGGAITDDGR